MQSSAGEHMLYRRTRSANARHALDGRRRTLVVGDGKRLEVGL